jgi:signal transduction histidine kinase
MRWPASRDSRALAMELARARDERQAARTAVERERIADLHAHLVREIVAASMTLSGNLELITDRTAHHRIAPCIEELDTVIRHIRDTIFRNAHACAKDPTSSTVPAVGHPAEGRPDRD